MSKARYGHLNLDYDPRTDYRLPVYKAAPTAWPLLIVLMATGFAFGVLL